MSFNSPAKQERVERHLMRQRGAGVRTVSSNFGFSFNVSAPTSQDATPIFEEPPSKRRRTMCQDGPTSIGASEDKTTDIKKSVKTAKLRKRLALDDDDDTVGRGPAVNHDDSFLSSLEAKRKAATKRKKDKNSAVPELVMAEEISKPVTKGKSKRHAAVTATAKVTDDFVEEVAPINNFRRDAEPEKKTRKKAKKPATLALEPEYNVEPDSQRSETCKEEQNLQDNSQAPKRKSRVKQVKKSVVKKANLASEHTGQEQANSSLIEDADATKVAVRPRNPSRRQKVSTTTTECGPSVELSVIEELIYQQEADELQRSHVDTLQSPTSPIKRLHLNPSKRKEPKKTSRRKIEPPGLDRQPLKETDVNLKRSLSPEKPVRDESKASKRSNAKCNVDKRETRTAVVGENNAQKRGKRLFVQIPRDISSESGEAASNVQAPSGHEAVLPEEPTVPSNVDNMACSATDGENLPSSRVSRPQDVETSASKAYKGTDLAGTKRKRLREDVPRFALETGVIMETKSERRVTNVGRRAPETDDLVDDDGRDEDVDWLFASQEPKQLPKATPRMAKPVSKAPRKVKMLDMDLDDLLADIASFAQAGSGNWPGRPGGESQAPQGGRQRPGTTKSQRR